MAPQPVRAVEVWVRWAVWRGLQLLLLALAAILYYVALEVNRREVIALQSQQDNTLPFLLKFLLTLIVGILIGLALKDFSKIPLRVRFDLPTGVAQVAIAGLVSLLAIITELSGLVSLIGRDLGLPNYFYSPWTFPYIWLGLAGGSGSGP